MMLKGEPILHLHVLIHDTSLELVDATINIEESKVMLQLVLKICPGKSFGCNLENLHVLTKTKGLKQMLQKWLKKTFSYDSVYNLWLLKKWDLFYGITFQLLL